MKESRPDAYGWDTEKSDLDVRRVFFPDIKQALSVFYSCKTKQHREKTEAGIIDFTAYPIQNFIRLLAKGNGNALDNLFEATGPPYPKLLIPEMKVAQLQKLVLENLHQGFLMHCTGYDLHLKKDLENETRLRRYGERKLLLNRYKILLEGLILAGFRKVVYNLRQQHEFIETKHCLALLENYQSGKSIFHKEINVGEVYQEVEQLHSQLVEARIQSKWPTQRESTIDINLEHWLVNQYLPNSFSTGEKYDKKNFKS